MSTLLQRKETIQGGFDWLTRSKPFRKLTKWAFQQCDLDQTGKIGKPELYAGILLVHVQLAKYAGAAACYPPSRQAIYELFDASDDDNSGSIDENEFGIIMVVCCAQISSRILVYYAIIILMVPYIADSFIRGLLQIDDYFGWNVTSNKGGDRPFFVAWFETALTYGDFANSVVSLVLFFLLVPLFFFFFYRSSRDVAEVTKAPREKADKTN